MQQMLNAVRAAGATQPIMIGGLNWAGDPCGIKDTGENGSCKWLEFEPSDPMHQLIASFHTYNWTQCNTLSCWKASVSPVASVVPVVTGELGEDDCSSAYVQQFMQWADQHNISYLLWAWQEALPTDPCSTSNLRLISKWSGSPNGLSGEALNGHLAQIYASMSRSALGRIPNRSEVFTPYAAPIPRAT